MIALESTLARMRRMGQSELFLGRVDSIDEVVERYNAVTREDVLDFARRTFDFSRLSVAALGKVRAREEYEALRLL